MSNDISIANYLRNGNECYDTSRLHGFLNALKAKGYYVCGSDWLDVLDVRIRMFGEEPLSAAPLSTAATKIVPEDLFIPAISQTLIDEANEFLHDKKENLDVHVYTTSKDEEYRNFECKFWIYPQDGAIYAIVGDYYAFHYYNEFLEVLQLFYDIWHPIYGFQEEPGEETYISREEALALNIPWLYELNLFGPEIVTKLGRERVLKSPAWRVHKFDDGGVLIVPALYISCRPNEEYRFSREEVANYLGLQYTVPDKDEDEGEEE